MHNVEPTRLEHARVGEGTTGASDGSNCSTQEVSTSKKGHRSNSVSIAKSDFVLRPHGAVRALNEYLRHAAPSRFINWSTCSCDACIVPLHLGYLLQPKKNLPH